MRNSVLWVLNFEISDLTDWETRSDILTLFMATHVLNCKASQSGMLQEQKQQIFNCSNLLKAALASSYYEMLSIFFLVMHVILLTYSFKTFISGRIRVIYHLSDWI